MRLEFCQNTVIEFDTCKLLYPIRSVLDNELQVLVSTYFIVKLAGKQQKLIVSNERENTSKGTKLVRKIPVLG